MKTSLKLNPPVMHQEDIDQAISQVIPMSLKGVDFHKNSSITWKHIGGLETAKQLLTEILIWPSKVRKRRWFFSHFSCALKMFFLKYSVPESIHAMSVENAIRRATIRSSRLWKNPTGKCCRWRIVVEFYFN